MIATSPLVADRRGSGGLQTIIVVSAIALTGFVGFKTLGSAASDGADCAGKSVEALAAVPCKDGGDSLPGSVGEPPPAPKPEPPKRSDTKDQPEFDPGAELLALAADIIGLTDAKKCFTEGDILACIMTATAVSPFKAIGIAIKLVKNAKRIIDLVDRFLAAKKAKKAADDARAAQEAADKARDTAAAGKQCKGEKCDKPGVCFAPGTPVHTQAGLVAIEALRPGDLVWSRNDQTGEEAYRPIARTFVTPDQPLLALVLEHASGAVETIQVTPPHPFHVEGRGWVAASELRPGDAVVSSGGGRMHVTSNSPTSQRTTVYNFEVEDFHTYFVGEGAAWVHNDCEDPPPPRVCSNWRARLNKAVDLADLAMELVGVLLGGNTDLNGGRRNIPDLEPLPGVERQFPRPGDTRIQEIMDKVRRREPLTREEFDFLIRGTGCE